MAALPDRECQTMQGYLWSCPGKVKLRACPNQAFLTAGGFLGPIWLSRDKPSKAIFPADGFAGEESLDQAALSCSASNVQETALLKLGHAGGVTKKQRGNRAPILAFSRRVKLKSRRTRCSFEVQPGAFMMRPMFEFAA